MDSSLAGLVFGVWSQKFWHLFVRSYQPTLPPFKRLVLWQDLWERVVLLASIKRYLNEVIPAEIFLLHKPKIMKWAKMRIEKCTTATTTTTRGVGNDAKTLPVCNRLTGTSRAQVQPVAGWQLDGFFHCYCWWFRTPPVEVGSWNPIICKGTKKTHPRWHRQSSKNHQTAPKRLLGVLHNSDNFSGSSHLKPQKVWNLSKAGWGFAHTIFSGVHMPCQSRTRNCSCACRYHYL